MKRKYLKGLCSIMAVTILSSFCMMGCGSTSDAGKKSDSEPVELKVEVFDRGIQGNAPADINYLTKWVNEEFGKPNNINVKFIPVPRNDEATKLNLLMASNEAPDVCFTYDENIVNNYVNQNGLTDLGPLLDEYGPNVKSYLDSTLSYGVKSGKQFTIPAKRLFTGITGTHVRKDWLDKLGLKAPTTTEEFYNVLKEFKEKDPGNLGDNNIPLGLSMLQMNRGEFNLLYSFRHDNSEEDLATKPLWLQNGVKDGYKFMNKLYNEGLISKDFALDKDNKNLKADVSNGKVGFYIGNVGEIYQANPGIATTLAQNVPNAEMVPCDPFSDSEGKHPKYVNSPYSMHIMVPKFSEHSVEAMKYLNWMCDNDVLLTLQNGIEGTQYEMKDGIPTPKTGEYEKVYNADYAIVANGIELGDLDKSIEANAAACPGFEDKYEESAKLSLVDGIATITLSEPNNSGAKYNQSLFQKSDEMIAKLVTCSPSEFDQLYDQLVDDYMKSGGTEVMNEAKEIYDKMEK